MRFQLGTMSVGDILDRGLKLYFRLFGTLFALNLIFQLPLLAFQLLSPKLDLGFGVAEVLAFLLALAGEFIGAAAAIKVIEQEYIGRRASVGAALQFALARFLPLLVVTVLYVLLVLVGSILCLIPGLIFATMFAFGSQVVVLERAGPFQAMGRSASLTERFRWRVFAILLLIGVIQVLAGFAIQLAIEQVFPYAETVRQRGGFPTVIITNYTNYVVAILVTTFVNILVSAYGTICMTLAYFDLRVRKEGFDLQVAAEGLALPAEPL